MKKLAIPFIAFVCVAVVFTLPSCQSTKSSTATKMLKFNFEKGKGYDYEMIINMDQEILGQTMKMDMATYYSMDVSDDDGNTKTISSSIDRFKLNMEVAGMNIEVDTDKPFPESGNGDDEKDPVKKMNRLFGAIKDQRFSMKVDAEGKVQEVKGFENMAESVVDSLNLTGEQRDKMMKQFNDQFSAKNIKEQFERVWYIFPNKKVKVGDSWQRNTETGGTLGGMYTSTYTVAEIEGDMVTLEEKTKVESQEEKMKLKGEITGTLVVDSRVGLVVNADQEMKMTATAGGMSFDIKGKTKIKGKMRN
ncbi:MAG: hypothetical protein IPI68_00475 [Chitinophagaceae bacterium]|nr:hypothetical protein [Chitinophagaceae bacterium]